MLMALANTRVETWSSFNQIIAFQLTSNDLEAFHCTCQCTNRNFETLQSIYKFLFNWQAMTWKQIDCTWQYTNRNFEAFQGIHCCSIDKRWFGSISIAPANARIEPFWETSRNSFLFNWQAMVWEDVDCTCQCTNWNFEKLQGIHFFSSEKQWLERILIAPANARIETLRNLKKSLAFQLTSNDLKAFGPHLPIHE